MIKSVPPPQAAQGMVRPASLREQLKTVGVMEDYVEAFVQNWTTHARAIVDRLRQYSLADRQVIGEYSVG